MSKPPQSPPPIEGYEYVRTIGRGGFSDVFLYTQQMPRREVAIKVLRTEALTESLRRQFAAEANLMARLSNHTNIASIYDADIDVDGEPYLVMEYCSGGSLGDTYRHYPMSVRDVLRIGVRISGALEAAHRAGIVHRDIKPANILLTEYGVPVLSDFGISTIDDEFPEATMARARVYPQEFSADSDAAIGLSLPWAAPETLGDPPVSDTRSDRYSLAATLYSLLEGRSPHEIPGGPNGASHLTGRMQSGFVGVMQRPDVPESLQAVLRRAMSYDRSARYASSIEFGKALRQIQRDLGHDVTPLDVPRGFEPAPAPPDPAMIRSKPPSPADVVSLPAGHRGAVPAGAGQRGPAPAGAGPATAPPHPGTVDPSGSTLVPGHTAAPAAAPTATPRPTATATATATTTATGSFPPPPATGTASAHAPGAHAHGTSGPGRSPARPRRRFVVPMIAGLAVLVALATIAVLVANRTASHEGPVLDHLEVAEVEGMVHVTIPADLPEPEQVDMRIVRHGLGPAIEEDDTVTFTVGHSSWLPGYQLHLDPGASDDHWRNVTLDTAEIEDLFGQSLVGSSVDSVLLVVAPRGYFPDEAPELRIDYPYSQVAALRITDAW